MGPVMYLGVGNSYFLRISLKIRMSARVQGAREFESAGLAIFKFSHILSRLRSTAARQNIPFRESSSQYFEDYYWSVTQKSGRETIFKSALKGNKNEIENLS